MLFIGPFRRFVGSEPGVKSVCAILVHAVRTLLVLDVALGWFPALARVVRVKVISEKPNAKRNPHPRRLREAAQTRRGVDGSVVSGGVVWFRHFGSGDRLVERRRQVFPGEVAPGDLRHSSAVGRLDGL